MKRTTAFLLALLLAAGCLFALAGCGKRYAKEDLSAYLDEEGFVPGMGQLGLQEIAKRYTGAERINGTYYDGIRLGGWFTEGETFRFENDYRVNENEERAIYTNSFRTTEKMPGLTLPCGIRFSDTMDRVLKRLSVDFDEKTEVNCDWSEGDKICSLTVFSGKDLSEEDFDLCLQYGEASVATRADGRETLIARRIRFFFPDAEGPLGAFEATVIEEYDAPPYDPNAALGYSLSEYLDSVGIVPGLSPMGMLSLAETIAGEEEYNGLHMEGIDGGWLATGDGFSFTNQTRVSDDEKTATYSNSVRTSVPLPGLLPYDGIGFSKTLTETLEGIVFDFDAESVFEMVDASGVATVWSGNGQTLELARISGDEVGTGEPEYRLEFREVKTSVLRDGRKTSTTRTLRLSFTDRDSELKELEMRVVEECERAKKE